uniref:Uncharacterized protein n=1 Tax=Bactrocera latifrons TaxID=174628 RepID=A0A0K8TV23_BACLA
MNFGNFGNTNCYRYLTSQVLAASRCGNYYGPDLFTNKNQPTFNKYQAQQERLRVKQQQAEQDYLCPSNYSAFINSINSNVMPEAANQAIRLNQQMGLQQLGRSNVPCRTDCNEITDSLWSAAKKSSIYVPDTATTWYECQREQNMGGNLSEKCKMFGISSRESYQPHQHLQLARPIRDGEQRLMDPKSFKHISPEFLSLLEEHEQAMLARNPLYGVDTKSERAPFCDVPRERLQKRHKSYSTTTSTTDKRTSRPQRQSRAKSRSRQDERRGLIQTISDTCFSDSPKSTKNRNSSLRQSKYNERMAGGEDGEFSKKKNFNETSRIKIRSYIKADVCSGGIFQPKENYELAALSTGYRPKSGVSLCGNMLKAECRSATAELTKKVQRKESVISKRKSREERGARTHKKCEDKENNKERSEIKDNNRHTHFPVRKDLFVQITVDEQHEGKRTKESNKLQVIWRKRDITRMRDSEISLQMANMRRYAEAESRGIVHGKTKLVCEEPERLKDIDRRRERTQLTHLRAKAGRNISQNDVVEEKVAIDFSSEVDDLAQISTEMKKTENK